MKVLITIIVGFLYISCNAQNLLITNIPSPIHFNAAPPLPVAAIGTIFSSDMKTSTGFTHAGNVAAGAWAYSDSGLTITPNATGTNGYDAYVKYAWQTNLENSVVSVKFVPLVDSAGLGVGVLGFLTGTISTYIGRTVLGGTLKGQVSYDEYAGGSPTITNIANSSTTLFSFTHGRTYTLSLTRRPDSIFTTVTDSASGTFQTLGYQVLYTVPSGNAGFLGQRQGQPTIFWYGGKVRITSFIYSSTAVQNGTMAWLGDSNMQGEAAGTDGSRYTKQVTAYFQGNYFVDAGASNLSADIVAILPEIILLNPRAVFVNIGTNDTDSAVFHVNIDTIRNALTRAGIKVYLATVFPTSSGVATLINTVVRAETGVSLIDLDATLLNGGSVLYAGYISVTVHLNTAGNNAVATQLKTTLNGYLTPN